MIRKSVETRDWLHTLEPRSARSVMKRVVEEVTLIDKQVGTLYEEGTKKEQGSGEASVPCCDDDFCIKSLSVELLGSPCCTLYDCVSVTDGGSRHTPYSYSLTQGGKGYPYSRYIIIQCTYVRICTCI